MEAEEAAFCSKGSGLAANRSNIKDLSVTQRTQLELPVALPLPRFVWKPVSNNLFS